MESVFTDFLSDIKERQLKTIKLKLKLTSTKRQLKIVNFYKLEWVMKEVEGFVERTEQGCFLFFFRRLERGEGCLVEWGNVWGVLTHG